MAEDLNNGPNGILPNPSSIYIMSVPPRGFLRLNFVFNALWENMVWVCSAVTGVQLVVKGNYFRDASEWVSEVNNTTGLVKYGVVAYHKHISPDASDAGSYPWIQSKMWDFGHFDNPKRDVLGFNDNDNGLPSDNARVTITYVGGIVQAVNEFRGVTFDHFTLK